MISTMVSNLFGGDKALLEKEVAEFHAIKKEINKARCVVEFDSEGNITYVNDNILEALSYSEKDLIGEHYSVLFDKDTVKSKTGKTFWKDLAQGQNQSGTFAFINQSDSKSIFHGYFAPVMIDNALVKVVAYLTDVTKDTGSASDSKAQLDALGNIQGVIEFDMQGNILAVNDVFAKVTGYTEKEIVGNHHSMFVSAEYKSSDEYKAFWSKLCSGQQLGGLYKRVGKGGNDFWTQALYIPILNHDGKPTKVIKYCTDVTAQEVENAECRGQLNAIDKIMGVIEFDTKGNILNINENFCNLTGYSKQEVIGKHHHIFVDGDYKSSPAYKDFWGKLASGEPIAGKFKRVAKNGKTVWLEASYNPIFNPEGEQIKVVKFATDITVQHEKDLMNQKNSEEANAIKNTLNSASTMMMMADNDGIIRYMNPAAAQLMQDSASKLKKVLPNFDPNNLIGQNFDVFHKTPSHQRNILASLTKPYDTTIPVDDLFFKLKASPIFNPDGARTGTSLEWVDVTQERHVEIDIDRLITAAVNGDFSERISLDDKTGTSEKICDGINTLVDKMTEIILQVREAGETINTAAGEISTGNNDLSSRTEQQASSLEETAASMEELASTVKQNAENALQANQLASAASGVAIKGGRVVGNVVSTMSAINESARKIEDIISVIDGIAFQTNILALNAAVEAARAGEQGRGFAVVAGEVRNLAQRSASAAKEIKELITDSVGKTTEGTKQVEEAGSTMEEIVASVQRVTDIMGEIAAASKEQSTGINQVNEAVTNMDEVTQQNAALVEEAAAAAESLVEQATSLMDTVSRFKLKGIQIQERRSNASPMRAPAKPTVTKQTAQPAPKQPAQKVVAKTGTDDGDWEEF